MYENGIKCQGYFRKLSHKKHLQQRMAHINACITYQELILKESAVMNARLIQFPTYAYPSSFMSWYKRYWRAGHKNGIWERIEKKRTNRKIRHTPIQLEEDELPD